MEVGKGRGRDGDGSGGRTSSAGEKGRTERRGLVLAWGGWRSGWAGDENTGTLVGDVKE